MSALYEGEVRSIGEHALDFKGDDMLIFFGPNAGESLEEFCVIIDQPQSPVQMEPGCTLVIGDAEFTVTAVGVAVPETFGTLGHCTVRFDGAHEAVLPGTVHVEGSFPEVATGACVKFERRQ